MYVQSELHLCFYYIFKEKKEEKMYKNKRSNLRAYVIKKLSSNRLNQPLYGPGFCLRKKMPYLWHFRFMFEFILLKPLCAD